MDFQGQDMMPNDNIGGGFDQQGEEAMPPMDNNGIGNNNEHVIYLESQDKDGFIIKKEICEFYYCYGVYGGCFAYIKDLATNEKFSIGKAL